MVKSYNASKGATGTPGDLPAGTPRDLYPTSDIRFVLVEIGKLSTGVDRLIKDTASHNDKLNHISHQISFLKGIFYCGSTIIAIVGGLLAWLSNTKWDAVLSALQALKH